MEHRVHQRLAHICILVWDIDQAIERYAKILGAVSPQQYPEEAEGRLNVCARTGCSFDSTDGTLLLRP